jgi:hypothetical protein
MFPNPRRTTAYSDYGVAIYRNTRLDGTLNFYYRNAA